MDAGRCVFLGGGWVGWHAHDVDYRVRVRFHRAEDGRLVADEVRVEAPVVTARMLKAIPLARIEAAANGAGDEVDAPRSERDTARREALFAAPAQPSVRELARQRRLVAAEPLRRPLRGEGDAYYSRVAARYQEVAAQTRAVASVLAAEADVPVTTVHRWVREARRRGLLPPARQGQAG